jgi:hypothetical protein
VEYLVKKKKKFQALMRTREERNRCCNPEGKDVNRNPRHKGWEKHPRQKTSLASLRSKEPGRPR